MSVKIDINSPDPLIAFKTKSGGEWEFIKVKGEGKDRKTVTLWPTNIPTGIEEGDAFRVTSITSAKYASRKDNQGVWRDEFSLNCAVEKVGPMPRQARTTDIPSEPKWTPPPKEPTLYDIATPEDGDDDGLPF
jgi:hypothetical protein